MTITRPLFTSYRALALVVGVLLVVGTLGSLAKYLLTEGTSLQVFGEGLWWVWVVHGWIYIAYVVVAFVLARRAGFSPARTLLLFVAGLIPVLMFFVEHQTVRDLRATHPEL